MPPSPPGAAPDPSRTAGGPPSDVVEVRGLRVEAVHGVLPEERRAPQPFELDLDLVLDTAPAAAADDLALSADYAAAVEAAVAVLAGPPRQLLETLAADVAAAVLDDRRVSAVTVVVRKLRPPLAQAVASTGVRIHRTRPGPGAGG